MIATTSLGVVRLEILFSSTLLTGSIFAVVSRVVGEALTLLEVDNLGFDVLDRKILRCVAEKFQGGPVGLDSLAAAIGESRDTIEDVIEPYLIQQGYLLRTPRGRTITAQTYRHFGLTPVDDHSRRS